MPEPAVTRPYSADDEAAVTGLLRAGLAEQAVFASQVDPPEDQGFAERELTLHTLSLVNDPENWIVAVLEGEVAGALRMRFLHDQHGPYASVREMVVAPEHRGRGVGRILILAAIKRAHESIGTRLFVNDIKTNPTLRLFEEMGFRDLEISHRLDRNPNHRLLWLPTRVDWASGPPSGDEDKDPASP